jgi:hypothetical protein
MRCEVELPLAGKFYPAGFPLHIRTNSRHVLESADESWSTWGQEFDVQPMRFHVVIQPEGERSGEPVFRVQDQLLNVVFDAHNFASADFRTNLATFHLSEKTAVEHDWLRWFFIESMAYMMLTQRHMMGIHAGCVARRGQGLLLCGTSGAGKSTLSFACARAGWTYIADDCTWLLTGEVAQTAGPREAIGRPYQVRFRPDVAQLFPELGGYMTRTRPNGKASIEIPMRLLPHISTAARCTIAGLLFLNRASSEARLDPVDSSEAVDTLICDMPSYGADVNAAHDRAVNELRGVPAWRLHYQTMEQALELLNGIQPE